jgi:hypothetical protein
MMEFPTTDYSAGLPDYPLMTLGVLPGLPYDHLMIVMLLVNDDCCTSITALLLLTTIMMR